LILLIVPFFNFTGQVIYGDTDSIMIYTGLDDISRAKAIAGKVIQEVGL
jgi:DNA polymerase alpha subunit A